MRKICGSTAILALVFAVAALSARAQETKPAEEKAEQKAKPATGLQAEILGQIDDTGKKLIALAEATPADKFGWRPGQGVRSVGEVFGHVSSGNYFFPTRWGASPPAGVDVGSIEKNGSDKAKTIEALRSSFDHLRQRIAAVPEADLDRKAGNGSVRAVMLAASNHAREHLGQSIAYARVNGITPPWSAQSGQ